MKTIRLILIFLFLKSGVGYSQDTSFTISGVVDTAVTRFFGNSTLIVNMPLTSNISGSPRSVRTIIDSLGRFSIQIPSTAMTYVSFEMEYKGAKYNSGILYPVSFPARQVFHNYSKELYLFEPGDDITMFIRPDGVIKFTGRNADRLNCQYRMYNIPVQPESMLSRAGELAGLKAFAENIELKKTTLELAIQSQLAILYSYKPHIPEQTYQQLYLDAVSQGWNQFWSSLVFLCYSSEEGQKAAQMFFQQSNLLPLITLKDSTLLNESAYYADMVFSRNLLSAQLFSQTGSLDKGDSFQTIYKPLIKNYSGVLRDKLLLICFQRMNRFYSTEIRKSVDQALMNMQENRFRHELKVWKSKQFSAYPFKLRDESGTVRSLEDYRGKVVVIDFWYTGCSNCITLHTAMKPIFDGYQEKDVVFISVSIDQDKEKWIKSVRSGKYTSNQAVNLYTNGLGSQHPIIQHYNILGYPLQLVIDKKGEMVVTNPPKVYAMPNGDRITESSDPELAQTNIIAFKKTLDELLLE
ncbi:TlpA family protein disulfide reductase [Pedobacter psychroterrae]|uniref:TlpA family protein disulfide reductase n=1 Tax=Pedobacter psychroterrae TaxID=2530453 RepID=A0A4R0NTB2_9SPHI|nr:TlpA disulfide reductase family protein [Pedobacter psychroterrae]TCD03163.1 TlpA family protein disulfide reductase [Pedobacter psychroterrae]